MKPRLAITMGDVNGIGPEILAKTLARPEIWELCRPIVVGSGEVLYAARQWAPECPEPRVVKDAAEIVERGTGVAVIDGGLAAPAVRHGQLDADAGRCAVEWVRLAIRMAMDHVVDGIVTCPINKEGIHLAGYAYSGHTELLATMTSSKDYRMCLFAGPMRVVHITSHCSLSGAIAQVRCERIAASIRIGAEALARLGLSRRRIAVAGVNPHAGEAGAFGDEEQKEIIPAVRMCIEEGIDCSGPYPPDTVFRRMREGEFDMVIAMYHDQGHIPLKLLWMDEGVNVTLGIPIIRTSVDHGTAYDIAGRGMARETSLIAAVRLAAQLALKRGATR